MKTKFILLFLLFFSGCSVSKQANLVNGLKKPQEIQIDAKTAYADTEIIPATNLKPNYIRPLMVTSIIIGGILIACLCNFSFAHIYKTIKKNKK